MISLHRHFIIEIYTTILKYIVSIWASVKDTYICTKINTEYIHILNGILNNIDIKEKIVFHLLCFKSPYSAIELQNAFYTTAWYAMILLERIKNLLIDIISEYTEILLGLWNNCT